RSCHPQAAGGARARDRAAGTPLARISRQVRARGNRALGEAGARGRHQRGLRRIAMKRAIAAFVILLASGIPLHAQDWPTRPVTMVVPFPAGGPIDVVARLLAPPMSELIGHQIIIDNVGGARGSTPSFP